MKKILFLALLMPAVAFAGSVTVNWTAATKNKDGSTIPTTGPDSVGTYKVEYGNCTGGSPVIFGTKAGETTVPGTQLTATIANLAPGTYCFRAYTITVAGGVNGTSDPTNVVSAVVSAPLPSPPLPPGNLTVISLTAFQILGTPNKIELLPVGTVPTGTQCDASQSVNGHNIVPRELVTWFGSVRPLAVVAKCG